MSSRHSQRHIVSLVFAALAATVTGCSESPRFSVSLHSPGDPGADREADSAFAAGDDQFIVTSRPSLVIQTPAAGETIHQDVFDGLSGVVSGLRPGQELFTFARDYYLNWFLMYPAVEISNGRFKQRNVRLPQGDTLLMVCVASSEASRHLHSCAKQGRYSFHASEFPDGVTPISSVEVKRE